MNNDTPPIIFQSILACYISDFLAEKRSNGYSYYTEEAVLKRFDIYCLEHNLETAAYSEEFLSKWCEQSFSEGIANHNKRVSLVRQLSIFLNSIGIPAYLPSNHSHPEIVLPHIFTDEERIDFFNQLDTYVPKRNLPTLIRLSNEYKVLFRMIYCCGLRNSEACGIASNCVDLTNGQLVILNAKGHKDRLVYMNEELTEVCRNYHDYLCKVIGNPPEWFFPASDSNRPLVNSNIDAVFNRIWAMTKFANNCNNKPTVHDLRFSFITDRINKWTAQGVDVEAMLPYLAQYVGHKTVEEVYYYYHTTKNLFASIQSLDKTSSQVIPEVK